MKAKSTELIMQNKIFGYFAIATTLILSLPLIAMQFTSEVNWDLTDFIVMAVLLFGASSIFVLVARVTPRKYRLLVAGGFLLAVLLTWAHLAVGIVDSWPLAGS